MEGRRRGCSHGGGRPRRLLRGRVCGIRLSGIICRRLAGRHSMGLAASGLTGAHGLSRHHLRRMNIAVLRIQDASLRVGGWSLKMENLESRCNVVCSMSRDWRERLAITEEEMSLAWRYWGHRWLRVQDWRLRSNGVDVGHRKWSCGCWGCPMSMMLEHGQVTIAGGHGRLSSGLRIREHWRQRRGRSTVDIWDVPSGSRRHDIHGRRCLRHVWTTPGASL
jgi:hypothetical protein